jgi:hypothetical protein
VLSGEQLEAHAEVSKAGGCCRLRATALASRRECRLENGAVVTEPRPWCSRRQRRLEPRIVVFGARALL